LGKRRRSLTSLKKQRTTKWRYLSAGLLYRHTRTMSWERIGCSYCCCYCSGRHLSVQNAQLFES
jgi:hypothetical protein